MNTDPRGVKRGKCLQDNCDCSVYEYKENMGAKCSYCFCPPTKHQKMDATAVGNSDLCGEVIATYTNVDLYEKEENYVVQELVPIQSQPLEAACKSTQDLLPKKLPKKVEMDLKNKILTSSSRNIIVRYIADKCFEGSVSSNEINAVADLAVKKWSPLKGKFGESSASLATQIKRRISKLRSHSKKEDSVDEKNGEIEETHMYNQQEMSLEMAKKSPSLLRLKQFLDTTREKRMVEVNSTPALRLMNLYPALKVPDLLLWEFTKIVNVPEDTLLERLKDFVEKMRNQLVETQDFSPKSESYDCLTVEILSKLPYIVPSGKRTADSTKFLLQIFEEDTIAPHTIPKPTDPPRLIAIGDPSKSITFFSYVDGTPIFSVKCPMRAVSLLLSTYWVFNIQFVPESRPAFLLLSYAVLRNEMPPKHRCKCSAAVHCMINQLNL